jgi:hypothetical protein
VILLLEFEKIAMNGATIFPPFRSKTTLLAVISIAPLFKSFPRVPALPV